MNTKLEKVYINIEQKIVKLGSILKNHILSSFEIILIINTILVNLTGYKS